MVYPKKGSLPNQTESWHLDIFGFRIYLSLRISDSLTYGSLDHLENFVGLHSGAPNDNFRKTSVRKTI